MISGFLGGKQPKPSNKFEGLKVLTIKYSGNLQPLGKNMLKKNIDTKDAWLVDLKIWKGAKVS